MSADITQAVVNEVADIMRRVGKREEIVDNIAENIDFSELIAEQLKTDGPVKEQAIKAIAAYLKGYEATAILKNIDFAEFVPTLLQNKDFQDVVADAVTSALEDGNLDVSEQVSNAIGEKDFEKVLSSEEVKATIAKKLKDYIDEYDMSNLSDDVTEKLDEVLFDPERIEMCLKENVGDINELVLKHITDFLESYDSDSDDQPVAKAIAESKTFQNAVDRAIDELIDSGKVTRLVEKVAADMLSGDGSALREKLAQAISTQLVNKVASSIVAQAFGK
jgi:hypothetical protein